MVILASSSPRLRTTLYPLRNSSYPYTPAIWLFQLALLNSSPMQCKHNTNKSFSPSKRSFLLSLAYVRKLSQPSTQIK